jgi:hypothetical protein
MSPCSLEIRIFLAPLIVVLGRSVLIDQFYLIKERQNVPATFEEIAVDAAGSHVSRDVPFQTVDAVDATRAWLAAEIAGAVEQS